MLRFLKSEEALESLNNLDSDDSDIEFDVLPDVSELTDEDEGDDNEVKILRIKSRFSDEDQAIQPTPRSNVTKEDGSGISGTAVQVQGGPVLSRIEPFRKPSLYNQHIQGGHSKQQVRQQPEQCQRSGRSRPHIPVQSRHSRQQDRQEPKDSPASKRSESLVVHIGDIKERRKEL
ncbi:hypothetical protein TNCV_969081 [Trichonephila clavipes]|nr:hypothetical protein TNCV_969081 [Trichonephila clavipes]